MQQIIGEDHVLTHLSDNRENAVARLSGETERVMSHEKPTSFLEKQQRSVVGSCLVNAHNVVHKCCLRIFFTIDIAHIDGRRIVFRGQSDGVSFHLHRSLGIDVDSIEIVSGGGSVFNTVSQQLHISLSSHINSLCALLAKDVLLQFTTLLLRQSHKTSASKTHPDVAAFKQRTSQKEVIVVVIGRIGRIHVDEIDFGLEVVGLTAMDITTINGYVSAHISQMHHRGISQILCGHLYSFEGGIVGSIEGKDAYLLRHLVGRVARFHVLVVINLYVFVIARRGSDGQGVVFRHAGNLRNQHPFVVFALCDADGGRSVDTLFQRIHSRLDRVILSTCPYIERSAHACFHRCKSCNGRGRCVRSRLCHNRSQRSLDALARCGRRREVVGKPEIVGSLTGHSVMARKRRSRCGVFIKEMCCGKAADGVCRIDL